MADLIQGLDAERVRAKVAEVRERIGAAARRAGRAPEDIELLAAVKYVAREELGVLAEAGLTLLGENRAQELTAKAQAWPDAGFAWDFIGHLQSRKVKEIAPHARLIHSVASDSALAQLARHRPRGEVLVEVNVAGEASKSGIAPAELPAFLERCPVPVAGLMTMPPPVADAGESRRHFAALRELADAHRLPRLSMGTSQDFEVAVEEGATIVRLGSILYERSS
jgi:pyridoxal phosphate enzyme (YggS family)